MTNNNRILDGYLHCAIGDYYNDNSDVELEDARRAEMAIDDYFEDFLTE